MAEDDVRQTEAAETEARWMLADFQQVLATPAGRSVMWYILDMTRFTSQTFDAENPYQTAFREGKRSIGIQLMQDILTARENADILMRREHEDRVRRLNLAVGGTDDGGR